jgi:hypothetical protein
MYDNKSRKDLIELLNKRNETIEILERRNYELENKLKELSKDNVTKLVSDLKKQKKNQAIIINQLRNCRADLLLALKQLGAKLD